MSNLEFDYIIGIDPGITTGVATYDAVEKRILALYAVKDPFRVMRIIQRYRREKTLVIIEGFYTQMIRTSHARKTVEYLGFFDYGARYLGYKVAIRTPQSRRAFLTRARQAAPNGASKHSVDALAHVLSTMRTPRSKLRIIDKTSLGS